MKKSSLYLIAISMCFLFMDACGVGENADMDPSSILQEGRLVDSPIINMFYSSQEVQGFTDERGAFLCRPGNLINFYFQDTNSRSVLAGTSPCKPIISPIDLVTDGTFGIKSELSLLSELEQVKIVRLLRLIQSLDVDLNPRTGIILDNQTILILIDVLNQRIDPLIEQNGLLFNFLGLSAFDFEVLLNDIMIQLNRENQQVSDTMALDYFNEFRLSCSAISCPEI